MFDMLQEDRRLRPILANHSIEQAAILGAIHALAAGLKVKWRP
jgi:hypothetical protein